MPRQDGIRASLTTIKGTLLLLTRADCDGAGEIFGGGVAPIIAGTVAQRYGIQSILWVAISGVALAIFVCAFPRETAPRKIGAPA